jgi:hypothetical protein
MTVRHQPTARPPANHGEAEPGAARKTARVLLYTVYAIYFFNGMALCFEGAFNPEFKSHRRLDFPIKVTLTGALSNRWALIPGIFAPENWHYGKSAVGWRIEN